MLLDDVETKLIGAGVVAGTTGWKLFKSLSPDDPDQTVVVYETTGEAPDSYGGAFVYPRFNIRVRGAPFDYPAARRKWQEIFEVLHNSSLVDGDASPPGAYVYCFAIQSGPIALGSDQNDRPMLGANFKTMRDR